MGRRDIVIDETAEWALPSKHSNMFATSDKHQMTSRKDLIGTDLSSKKGTCCSITAEVDEV